MLPLIPKEGKNFKLKDWLIQEGYPPHEIMDNPNFACRMWETE
jgi:hypothetical protein